VTDPAAPDLAHVALRVWVRAGCPGDVAAMGDVMRQVLDVVLPEHDRRRSENTTMNDLVRAAQDMDYQYRPRSKSWHRVPDDQVRRLIAGALAAIADPETAGAA
jgi:hypothetical protein